jgi:hypothetical protein
VPQLFLWSKPSNAPLIDVKEETFKITHPFHPLSGKSYHLLAYKHTWGEDRVYYHDEDGKLSQVPVSYTNAIEPDPYVVVNAGQSAFRVLDLLELCRLIDKISSPPCSLKQKKERNKCVR